MRSEQTMMDLILTTAQKDERIRAVYMNGSRVNPNVSKDIFQDYDIVYVVKDTTPFIQDNSWIDVFGKVMYMQMPEAMDKALQKPCDHASNYGWLMQFVDGNRIDLHVQSIPYAKQHITDDSLCTILFDKDCILPKLPASTDKDYWISKPSYEEFLCCCNEFWWLQNNIAKGLWRSEITYVMDMQNLYARPQVLQLCSWYAGLLHGFNFSIGKSAKYLENYLPQPIWNAYLQSFSTADISDLWIANMKMCELFQMLAPLVSKVFSYPYNEEEALHSLAFLNHIHILPKDAKEIY